jgi:aspartate carbamoyltransferase
MVREQPWSGFPHVLSASQFSSDDIAQIFERANSHRLNLQTGHLDEPLRGRVVGCAFFENLTRTFTSFDAAALRLGAQVIELPGMVQYSSVAKGETLEDTVRTLECYVDAIVMRHPKTGAAKRAAAVMHKPLINAGDGTGEHPTQALLDLYTIRQRFPTEKKIKIVMLGDMLNGRTIHSLSRLLCTYMPGSEVHFVSPSSLGVPSDLFLKLSENGLKCTDHPNGDFVPLLRDAHVLYVTRVQAERMKGKEGKSSPSLRRRCTALSRRVSKRLPQSLR